MQLSGLSSGHRNGLSPFKRLKDYMVYLRRVLIDLGLVRDNNIVRDLYNLYKGWGALDKIKITILPEAGRKENVISPTVTNISKLYNLCFNEATIGSDFFTNGFDWIDTNNDGAADGIDTAAGRIYSIVTGNGFTGNAQRSEYNGAQVRILFTGNGIQARSIGCFYQISGKYRSSHSITFDGPQNFTLPANPGNAISFTGIVQANNRSQNSWVNNTNTGSWMELGEICIKEYIPASDAIQATQLSQPVASGNIAPNEKLAICNPNGGSKYMTFPPLSFSATDQWSITICLNSYGGSSATISNGDSNNFIRIRTDTNIAPARFEFRGFGGTQSYGISNKTLGTIGKNAIITFVAQGDNTLRIYVNSILVEIQSVNTGIVISQLLKEGSFFQGTLSYFSPKSIALSPSQVSDEYKILRNYIPEMPNVRIGDQVWASSNCQLTNTIGGNQIFEMQLTDNTEKIPATSSTFDTDGTGIWSVTGGTKLWDSVNKWLTITSTDVNCRCPTSIQVFGVPKWNKVSYLAKSSSYTGKLGMNQYYATTYVISNPNLNSSFQTISFYAKGTGADQWLYLFSGLPAGNSVDIDNISIQEVGWNDATNLYNAIYAQATGTDEQKTYAACKAAGFWCHYNNDPALGAIYGKQYNGYATKLIQMDVDYYNAANPSNPWGWRVPTSADFTTLQTYLGGSDVAGGKLKMPGTSYWTTPNTGADNSSGFTALGAGMRTETGSPSAMYKYFMIWSIDEWFLRIFNDQSVSQIGTVDIRRGLSLRFIKA
jgi:uncharacterized protein (TIGR02145 family)